MDTATAAQVGIAEWFRLGEYERVERVIDELRRLGVGRLRTSVSWADWFREEAPEWYGWMLPRLAREFEVLPCLLYTPPSIGIVPNTSSPPKWAPAYSDFVVRFLLRFEHLFEHVELWNEPNCISEWDWRIDPDWSMFCEMIAPAAHIARKRRVKVVLGGMSPPDASWLELMCERGVVDYVDAVGIHGFPGTWEAEWDGWDAIIARLGEVLERHDLAPEIWITETGYSTWNDEYGQVLSFVDAVAAPADRVYWFCAEDLASDRNTMDGFHNDEREYHLGLRREDGEPKLLARIWAEAGLEGVDAAAAFAPREERPTPRATVITGADAPLAAAVAEHVASSGGHVRLVDPLHDGVHDTLRRLCERHPDRIGVVVAELRDRAALRTALEHAERVCHLGPRDPKTGFALTMHVLDELTRLREPPPLLVASRKDGVAAAAANEHVRTYVRRHGLHAELVEISESDADGAAAIIRALGSPG